MHTPSSGAATATLPALAAPLAAASRVLVVLLVVPGLAATTATAPRVLGGVPIRPERLGILMHSWGCSGSTGRGAGNSTWEQSRVRLTVLPTSSLRDALATTMVFLRLTAPRRGAEASTCSSKALRYHRDCRCASAVLPEPFIEACGAPEDN